MTASTSRQRIALRIAGLLIVSLAATGCTRMERFHGFTPSEAELATVALGQTTKADIITSFGPPTADRGLENNTIYYVSSQFSHFGALPPKEVDRKVVAVQFDSNDVVRNISRYALEDGRAVLLDRRVTDDGINDVTFLAQLLGSFGRIDAGSLLGDSPQ